MAEKTRKRNFFGIAILVCCAIAITMLGFYMLFDTGAVATANIKDVATTGKTNSTNRADLTKINTGPSGLPLPRFVSLKREKVNVRRGPSSQHKIAWIFKFKGLPVEIIAEFEHWRRIRDSEGQEGWVYHSLLSGRRTIAVAPWRKGSDMLLYANPEKTSDVLAKVSAGAVGKIENCTGKWCKVKLGKYDGWISQALLWGVYPNEKLVN